VLRDELGSPCLHMGHNLVEYRGGDSKGIVERGSAERGIDES
jgi:hypothetical protein